MTAIKSSAPQIFEYDYYQKLHDLEESHWWSKGMRVAMHTLIGAAVADRGTLDLEILDAGCGTGYLMHDLARYSTREVMGLDYSAHALAFCRTRGLSRLVLGSAVEPPFVSASFDLIICTDTLQHLSPVGADQTSVDDFARLLRRGGLLYIRTNSAAGHAPMRGADASLYRRYTRRELIDMMSAAGLTVERATHLNMLPSVWAMMVEYARAIRERRAQQANAIGPGLAIRPAQSGVVERILSGVLNVEARLIGAGVDLPFGHSQAILARNE